MKDTYKTITGISEGLYKSKGSKFLSFCHPVCSESEVKEIIAGYKKSHHDARHHCYAYMLKPNYGVFRANDDGEPSNSAGKPILGQLQSFEVTNTLVVVIRYFGGTLLGVGGLITAYKAAAAEALSNANIITKTIYDTLKVHCTYDDVNHIMRIVKDNSLDIKKQDFAIDCNLEIDVPKSKTDYIHDIISKIHTVDIKLLTN